jgi:hypothetical protein
VGRGQIVISAHVGGALTMLYCDFILLLSAVEKDPEPTVLRCSDPDPEILFRIRPSSLKTARFLNFFTLKLLSSSFSELF